MFGFTPYYNKTQYITEISPFKYWGVGDSSFGGYNQYSYQIVWGFLVINEWPICTRELTQRRQGDGRNKSNYC